MPISPSDTELVELVKTAFGYQTDTELAGFLGVRKETISAIRTGRSQIGEGLRFTILDKILLLDKVAYRFIENKILFPQKNTNISLSSEFSPTSLRARLIALRRKQHESWALPEIEKGAPAPEDGLLLDIYKAHKGFATDDELATSLGIKRNSVSMVRHGHSKLGALPRLRIYRDATGGDTTNLEAALESSENLLKLLKQMLSP